MKNFIRNYEQNREHILSALGEGKIIAYPTDTIFGLGADAMNPSAVQKLYDLKKRPRKLPFSIMVPHIASMLELIEQSGLLKPFLTRLFPGPVTAVLPLRDPQAFNADFLTNEYAGFRIPDHPFCRWLGKYYSNPVITTSANVSGEPPLNNLPAIEKVLQDQVSLYIDDPAKGFSRLNVPSTVFKIDKNFKLEILRKGAVSPDELFRIWKETIRF